MEEELDEVASGERAVGAAPARVLRPAARPRRREAARAAQRFTTEATDEVCSLGPPDGHPARPQRAVPRLLAVPGAQGDAGRCPATSRRPRRGPARSARSAARARSSASAAGSGRSSAARATRTATTSRRTARRRRIRCRSRSTCPKNKDGHLVPRRARRTGNVFWGCSNYPRCDYTTNYEPLGGLHDTDDGPLARKDDDGDLPGLRLDQRRRPPADIVPGRAVRRAARRTRRRSPGRPGARRRRAAAEPPRPAAARVAGAAVRRSHDDAARRARSSRPPTRERGRRPRPATDPALARFLRSLAARDASPHTQRAYAHGGRRLSRLAGRARRRLAAPDPGRPARLPRRPRRGPRALVGRPAARRDPLVPSLGDAERPRAGRPVGLDRDAAPAAPPAARPRGRAGRRLLAVVDADLDDAVPGDDPDRAALRLALALRDRALVETAYAAGPADQRAGRGRPRRRSTCGAARSGSSARAARSGSGCSAGRPARRSRPTSRTAGRSCSSAATTPSTLRRPRSS